MKIILLILFGLFFSTVLLNAQTDFRPGYIIELSGDTIYGEIDYRGDLLMSKICKFKNVNNDIYEYFPNDILAFRFIDSKYYESRDLNNKKVFLEYLIKGKINIYFMHDEIGDHYYLDKEDVELIEIPYEEGIKYIGDKRVYFQTTNHIGLFNYYMRDAQDFQARIQKEKKLEHQSLIELAKDYHNNVCDDEQCVIYEKTLPVLRVSVEVFTGITKYNRYNKYINEYGGHLFLWAPRVNEKLFFKTGIVKHQLLDEGESVNIYKIPIQLQYIYRRYRIQPNISGGFNFYNITSGRYNGLEHSLSLNAGLNYRFSNAVSISTSFNSDFTSIGDVMMQEGYGFDIISYSVIAGFRIDL